MDTSYTKIRLSKSLQKLMTNLLGMRLQGTYLLPSPKKQSGYKTSTEKADPAGTRMEASNGSEERLRERVMLMP